jgi:hypothetical protein
VKPLVRRRRDLPEAQAFRSYYAVTPQALTLAAAEQPAAAVASQPDPAPPSAPVVETPAKTRRAKKTKGQ